MRFLFALALFLLFQPVIGQDLSIKRIEPPFWWAGMNNTKLQVMVYGPDIAYSRLSLSYPGITVESLTLTENPNYLFVNLLVSPDAKPGIIPMVFSKGEERLTVQYELKQRQGFDKRIQGLHPGDLVYLIMPDRFANGDPANDNVPEMLQSKASRTGQYQRHGGDIQGILGKLDYLQDLGATALWLNPVWENNQPKESYHGYAATDLYRVDSRLGDNELYRKLADELHKRGMKLVTDIVHNHVGNESWLYKDLPSQSWVHQFDTLTRSNFRSTALMDPYASERDRMLMANGWFDAHMPDLNQQDPLLATYLIQNNIWWVEYSGLDAFRVDTYPYPDQEFMKKWAEALLAEYPQLTIFGETWVQDQGVQSWFAGNEKFPKAFNSHLPGVTDFQIYYGIMAALNQNPGWDEGLGRLYNILSQDYLYEDPNRHVTFLDNHDVGRFYAGIGQDFNKWKMGIAMLLTLRGIPQVYYGTEVLMSNNWDGSNHDKVREEFPGGWAGDKVNKFTPQGRSVQEQQAFTYFRQMARFRAGSEAIRYGKMMHFIPENGVYVYFRYTNRQTVMVVVNANATASQVGLSRFAERLGGYQAAQEIISGTKTPLKSGAAWGKVSVPAKTAAVFLLE